MNICLAVFCYNREKHLKSTLDALLQNPKIGEYPINFYIDGPVKKEDKVKITAVCNLIDTFKHPNKLIVKRQKNIGLADNIITGLNHSFESYDAVIVLEDDVVVNKHFLHYMISSLVAYNKENNVWHISAWSPLTHINKNEAYFSNRMACSGGWATWRRSWKHFYRDIDILNHLKEPFLHNFDPKNKLGYKKQLVYNKKKIIKTWAIYWALLIFLNDKLCLNPVFSFTKNIGFDASGIHSGKSKSYDNLQSCGTYPITLPDNITIDKEYTKAFEDALLKLSYVPIVIRILSKIKRLLKL